MGGRSGSSGMSGGATFDSLGLKVENGIDPDMFTNAGKDRYGGYAHELASDIAEYMDEDLTIVSYAQGGHKAYAVLSLKNDEGLEAIVSTGGGTGTKLLSKVMKYLHGQGKGMYWTTDNDASRSYYDSMGLGKYRRAGSKSQYSIDRSQMSDAIKLVNKRAKR